MWTRRAYEQLRYAKTIVMLQMCDPSTRNFALAESGADEIRLLDRRVRYGNAKGSPRFASMIVVFRYLTRLRRCGLARISGFSYREWQK